MPHITRSAQAERDIEQVLVYTRDTWGAAQADRYALLIEEGLESIAENPGIGRSRFAVRLGILAHHISQRGRHASHFLYYRIDSNGDVEVVRFLHERMDPGQHLQPRLRSDR